MQSDAFPDRPASQRRAPMTMSEQLTLESLALEQAAAAVVACDPAGTIVVANATARSWLGGIPASARALGAAADPLLRALSGEPVTAAPLRLVDAAGAMRSVSATSRPLVGSDGRVLGAVLTLTDHGAVAAGDVPSDPHRVTPVPSRLDANAIQLQRMESIGRLAGGVAHDFNNQLTVINGMLDLALSGLDAEDPLAADLQEARHAGTRAAGITRQLLAFSRQQVMRQEVADLNTIVRDLTKMIGRLLGDDVILQVDLQATIPPVFVDIGQMEQVILNLAVNARDAMPTGGELRIVTSRQRAEQPLVVEQGILPPGDYVVLRITDQGAGIEARVRQHIFEPFFTTKEFGRGTGLGLSTVLGIVTQSGGGITVESAPGAGATFTIILPASDREGRRLTPPGSHAAPHAEAKTVLIVDDEASLRTVAAKILQRAGFHVLTAGGGDEAIAVLAQHQGVVDLLLTDVVMPSMSGVELAATIAPRYPALKVLFTSGYTDDTVFRHGLGKEQVDFLPKPYSIQDLTRQVQRLLRDSETPTV